MTNNIKHKSIEDNKSASFAGAVKNVGGQKEADDLLVHWENHRRSEHLDIITVGPVPNY